MPNVKQTIGGHNKTKLSETATTTEKNTCNCKKKRPMSKKSAQCPKNVWSSPLYIKLQFLPTTIVHLKHTLVLLKTLLKLDITTIKPHSNFVREKELY